MLQRMIVADPNLAQSAYRPPRTTADDIRGIVISPTRELAEQIAVEARRVVNGTSIVVQTAVGGTDKRRQLMEMQRRGCHLLIGTPGRLQDLFDDEYSGVAAPRLKALVMDEADRLLDQGFWPDIQRFMQTLPRREEVDRQTMMFSATIPREVVSIVRQTLKTGFQFVRIVGENDTPTTDRVKQKLVIAKDFENLMPTILELVQRRLAEDKAASADATHAPFKAILYFRSTAEVTLASSIFESLSSQASSSKPASDAFGRMNNFRRGSMKDHPLSPIEIYSIQSKLSQNQRTAAAEAFRQCKSGMLFSSDVTARGLDFPNVTHVIQVGGPQDRESYIHRIGRTARAGKEGEGWIIVTHDQVNEVDRMLRDIPIDEDRSLTCASQDISSLSAPTDDTTMTPAQMIRDAARRVPAQLKKDVYHIMLAARGSKVRDRAGFVRRLNRLAKDCWGMDTLPLVDPQRAAKMGLSNVEGLSYGHDRDDNFGETRSRFGGGRSGGNRFGGNNQGGSRFGSRRDEGRAEKGYSNDSGRDRSSRFGNDRNSSKFGNDRNDKRSSGGRFDRGGR